MSVYQLAARTLGSLHVICTRGMMSGSVVRAWSRGGEQTRFEFLAERGVRVTPFLVEPDGPALSQIAKLIDAGEVAIEVEAVFELEQAAQAHAQGESGRTRGKLVLRLAD